VIHGKKLIKQPWFHCIDCKLVGALGCCAVCAKTCHAGHNVVSAGTSPGAYCDCGSDSNGKCKARYAARS
jgi:hypothetical protein